MVTLVQLHQYGFLSWITLISISVWLIESDWAQLKMHALLLFVVPPIVLQVSTMHHPALWNPWFLWASIAWILSWMATRLKAL